MLGYDTGRMCNRTGRVSASATGSDRPEMMFRKAFYTGRGGVVSDRSFRHLIVRG